MWMRGRQTSLVVVDTHDSKGIVMAMLTLTPRRMITPIAAVLVAVALAATLALGFGLRTWTEHTSRPSAPSGAVHSAPVGAVDVHPAQPLRKIGKPW